MKRFSKIVSVIVDVPRACVISAMNCACMSVAKPGYSSVVTSAASSFLAPRTRSRPGRCFHRHDVRSRAAWLRIDVRCSQRAIGDLDVAAGNRSGDQKRAGLDAVGNDGVRRAVQPLDSAHAQRCRAVAFDARAHLAQQFHQVGDFRLARRIVEHASRLRPAPPPSAGFPCRSR